MGSFKIKTKKSIVLIAILALGYAEYALLNNILSKDLLKIVYAAELKDRGVPLFTMGYSENLKIRLANAMRESNLKCRSLNLKISHAASEVFYDLEMYCEKSRELSSAEDINLLYDFKSIIDENKALNNSKIQYFKISSSNESSKSHIPLLLSLLFCVFVGAAFPWYFLGMKERE